MKKETDEKISDEKSIIWNGSIGLMSVSDYLRANTNSSQCGSHSLNQTYYIVCKDTNWMNSIVNSSPNGHIWTINPYSGSAFYVFYANNAGNMDYYYAYGQDSGYAPAPYLKSNITLTGSGTTGIPYEIS